MERLGARVVNLDWFSFLDHLLVYEAEGVADVLVEGACALIVHALGGFGGRGSALEQLMVVLECTWPVVLCWGAKDEAVLATPEVAEVLEEGAIVVRVSVPSEVLVADIFWAGFVVENEVCVEGGEAEEEDGDKETICTEYNAGDS